MITGIFCGAATVLLLIASAIDGHRKKTASKEPK